MSKVPFTQNEADALIAMPKHIAHEGQIYNLEKMRIHEGFHAQAFEGFPNDIARDIRFVIVTQANFDIDSLNITLEAQMGTGPMQAICRYDLHDRVHHNYCICCGLPPKILPGAFHLHRYNECCLGRGNPWDKCATLLPELDEPSQDSAFRKMVGLFVTQLKVSFSDSQTAGSLFQSPSKP